jgi:hypothetical protein
MEKKGENSELPIKEMKYSQNMEEMKQLIPVLKDLMISCPSEEVIFNLLETIDQYSFIRNFKIKTKSEMNNNQALNKFKDNFLTDISSLETFTVIPTINSFEIEQLSSKGKKFKCPKIYDINGDEIDLRNFGGKEIFFFLYDNIADLKPFIMRNNSFNSIILCLGINLNFFQTKKWIKNNGLLNNKLFNFCFTEISMKSINTAINLKISNLPRIAIIGADGVIHEDKCIKNVNFFNLQKDLINRGPKGYNSDEQAKIENFVYLDNENKRRVVKSMNIYLKNNGLNNVHFYVKSKICIDKKGIKKMRCYPVFYGEAKPEEKNMVDNFVNKLNGQQLFYEIQCKVKYI